MRKFLLIILIIQFGFDLSAQDSEKFGFWFYEIPFFKNPKKVCSILQNDERFASRETISSYYLGNITTPYPQDKLAKLDSATIRSGLGSIISFMDKKYSRRYFYLGIEYFSTDTLVLNNLFDLINIDLGQDYKEKIQPVLDTDSWQSEEFPKEEVSKNDIISQTMNIYVFLDNKRSLRKFSIAKRARANGTRSVWLELVIDK
ncbi:MAG: hypothetical protein COB88_09160 [Flavobacteriales bacterium]|nr:MAG: hypothetical protein COB88_09160 [Flavobacteriales bacterium]